MTTTTRRGSGKLDAILILKQMHEDVKGQFEELLHTYYPFQAQELWRQLQPVLNRHEQIEETYVYGPLRRDSGAVLVECVKQHDHQVKHVRRLIQEANALESLTAAGIHSSHEFGTRWANTFGKKRSRSSPELSKFGALLGARRPDNR